MSSYKIAIVISQFNKEISDNLLEGALDEYSQKFEDSRSNIEIFDVSGNHVEQILSNVINPGTYEIQWNAQGLPSGVYFIHMNTGNLIFTEKVLLLK